MSHWAEQWDSPLRWSVKSQTSNQIYIVDLGLWLCQCTRASCMQHHAKWLTGASRMLWENQCFHKITAMRAFYEAVVVPSIRGTPILEEFLKPEFAGHRDALTLAFIDHLHAQEIRKDSHADSAGTPEHAMSYAIQEGGGQAQGAAGPWPPWPAEEDWKTEIPW